jgi:hypothetical protein
VLIVPINVLLFAPIVAKRPYRMDPTPAQLPLPKRPRVGKSRGGRKELPEAEKRTKRIVLHVTEATYAELQAQSKASGRPIAVLVRAMTRPQRRVLTPEQFGVLRQIAGMANNLNQLAKRGHQDGFSAVADQALAAADQVSQLLDSFTQAAGADD